MPRFKIFIRLFSVDPNFQISWNTYKLAWIPNYRKKNLYSPNPAPKNNNCSHCIILKESYPHFITKISLLSSTVKHANPKCLRNPTIHKQTKNPALCTKGFKIWTTIWEDTEMIGQLAVLLFTHLLNAQCFNRRSHCT